MNPKKKKLIVSILGALVLYLASTGLSYGVFRFLGGGSSSGLVSPVPVEKARSELDLSGPKTEACPINGKLFTKVERSIWEGRRPIAVMIENHEESRPQSGLSSADVVYEAVAEGGITRFLAVYLCGASAYDVKLAPVRSSRVYFIDWASEYGELPIYVHVGGANDFAGTGETHREARALELLAQIGWRYRGGNDFDTTLDGGFPVFWREEDRLDHPVAVEHTMCSSTDRIWQEAHERGFDAVDDKGVHWNEDFVSWKFKEEARGDQRGDVGQISFNFWDGYKQYEVEWRYSPVSNEYLRYNGGQPHQDLESGEQLKAKAVVVQFVRETGPVDANKHLLYDSTGKGKALIFQDGEVLETTWAKTDRQGRTIYSDSRGQEVEFNPGQTWIEIVPSGNQVSY